MRRKAKKEKASYHSLSPQTRAAIDKLKEEREKRVEKAKGRAYPKKPQT